MSEAFALFVGSAETARIESIVSKEYDGFTLMPAVGYWHGNRESSTVVIISRPDSVGLDSWHHSVSLTVGRLKSDLRQESIGIEELPVMHFV